MKTLQRKADQAFAAADSVQTALLPGESAAVFLERSARRRLVCDAAGKKQLLVEEPAFSGFVRLEHEGRELYLNASRLTASSAARLLATGRPLFSLGSPAADGGRPNAHPPARPAGAGAWCTTGDRLDMGAAASRTGALMAAVGSALRPGQVVAGIHVSDILREAVYLDSPGTRLEDQAYGVEITAVVVGEDGSAMVSATRYARTLDDIDPEELGRELALLHMASAAGGQPYTGTSVVLTPSATAALLRALANTVLLNPVVGPAALATSLVDEGPRTDGYGARSFDCEGTTTGTVEFIGRDGRQHTLASRRTTLAGHERRVPAPLTGHAWWNPLKNFPLMTANNVSLTRTAGTTADGLLADERCVVTDARTLGVEEFRSGGQLAFRLLAARATDGVPRAAHTALTVEGSAVDFLTSITQVGDTVSYFPGQISAGGAYLEMDLTRITSKAIGS
ncbi:hypothetical protein HUT11_30065 [Streptomyces seoulensis]|nr:hypothetical protein HUT11_30065 [Streptomyces seoulensis]